MATLDTNVKNATAAEITITTETVITLYVCSNTGGEGDYRIVLEVSPDSGTTWCEVGETLAHPGVITISCATTKARVKVLEAQGTTSRATVFLLAN